jgi:predicted nucleic acid-binding protein
LFAGIWSSTGGSRMILKLGEAEAIQLLASAQVLQEIENALREKAPGTLGY